MNGRKRSRSLGHDDDGLKKEDDTNTTTTTAIITKKNSLTESSSNQKDDNDTGMDSSLSPHTQRLIQLITTSSKDDENEEIITTAIGLLTRIASKQSTTNYQLWDILGQLQRAILAEGETNQYASSHAMKCILQSCVLSTPTSATDIFIFHDDDTINMEQRKKEEAQKQWLSVQDLLPPCNKMNLILNQGHVVLLSHDQNNTMYDDELNQLDESKDDNDDTHFCQRRVELQREILAKRLGLYYNDYHLDPKDNVVSSSFLTIQDFQYTRNTTNDKTSSSNGRKKQKVTTTKDSNKDGRNQFEKVLLWQVRQQQQNDDDRKDDKINNKKPQILLATEFLYRMFDPNWHIRYGALFGILAFVQASSVSLDKQQQGEKQPHLFGKWNQDLLTRCLFVLALEQFGDYSGTLSSSKSQQKMMGSSVIFPVQEMTAQVIALLYRMAPRPIQSDCWKVLKLLSKHDIWHIRHGALLTFNYLSAAMLHQHHQQQQQHSLKGDETKLILEIALIALDGFGDSSADVIAVAAQILQTLLSSSQKDKIYPLCQSHQKFWNTIQSLESFSPCCVQVLSTCSLLLQNSPNTNVPPWLFPKLFQFLTVHNVPSVYISCYQALSCILPSITKCDSHKPFPSLSKLDDKGSTTNHSSMFHTVCQLLQHMFHYYWNSNHNFTEQNEASNMNKTKKTKNKIKTDDYYNTQMMVCLQEARNETWNVMVHTMSKIFGNFSSTPSSSSSISDSQLFSQTNYYLLLKFLDIEKPASTTTSQSHQKTAYKLGSLEEKIPVQFSKISEASNAFVQLLTSCNNNFMMIPTIIFIQCILQSPWPIYCETGCVLLYSLLANSEKKMKFWKNLIVEQCQPLLQDYIYSNKQKYISYDSFTSDSAIILQQMALCHEALASSLKSFLKENPSLSEFDTGSFEILKGVMNHTVQEILHVWDTIIPISKISTNQNQTTTITSMRLLASLSTSMIALQNLPSTMPLTPIIRALMTSLKNETCNVRLERTIQSLASMIQFLSKNAERQAVCYKIMNTISSMACIDVESVGEKSLTKGYTKTGCQASQRAIQLIVKQLQYSNNDNPDSYKNIINPIWKRLQPLSSLDPASSGEDLLLPSLVLFSVLSESFSSSNKNNDIMMKLIVDRHDQNILPSTTLVACASIKLINRKKATISITNTCRFYPIQAIPQILPILFQYVRNINDDSGRLGACTLFYELVKELGVSICPFVRYLLPLAMSMMTDPVQECAKLAASTFATIVRIAPLVATSSSNSDDKQQQELDHATQTLMKQCCPTDSSDLVIDHLIHGQPFPPYALPQEVDCALKSSGIALRDYQKEGIAWIQFLQSVKLNGALCDDMGLGKTLQSLIGVAIAHSKHQGKSLVVCPSTLVRHWVKEVQKFFSNTNSCLKAMSYDGNAKQRKEKWSDEEKMKNYDVIVTSYPVLRNDIHILKETAWIYCILDEGHLLKNPKTATAKSARKLKSQYRMILTGTPVQNKVHELWAVFDFLMPNYLGSESDFSQNYAKAIVKGQLPGASTESIRESANKLKMLHQQVLPFILRREKNQVMKELPPKTIIDIPCVMSDQQIRLYKEYCSGTEAKRALKYIEQILKHQEDLISIDQKEEEGIGREVLRSLFYMRLLCTHPILLSSARRKQDDNESNKFAYFPTNKEDDISRLDCSGKLLALNDLMRSAGIFHDELTAADNDESALYISDDFDINKRSFTSNDHIGMMENDNILNWIDPGKNDNDSLSTNGSKCLIFAQFTQSLDVVENFLFAPHMSSLKYLRLDGRVPAEKRSSIADRFNNDQSIRCMLLTTKVGGLGLNLTGADTVIFLEHDWNPHADLQAMDRVHRIGQTKAVHVYRLITSGSIEEKVMELQRMKLSMSKAIVNSDNSTMYSMGTNRLLDLFTTTDTQNNKSSNVMKDDDLWCHDEYSQLSLTEFVKNTFMSSSALSKEG